MTKWPYTKYANVNPQVLNYFPFEKARKHQLETISEILEAVDNGYKYIVLEAGTGTGKSAIAAGIFPSDLFLYFVFAIVAFENTFSLITSSIGQSALKI